LANFALFGWFVGLGHARTAFVLQLLLNALNIGLAVLFGLHLEGAAAGVGLAAFLADTIAAVVGVIVAWRVVSRVAARRAFERLWDRARLIRMMAVNRDIMIRTLCVVFAFSFFTSQLARQGDVSLAANAILFQFVTVSAYLLDGFAFAAESLVGKAIGARHRDRYRDAVWISSVWALGTGILASLFIGLAGGLMIDALTTNAAVRAEARGYLTWAAIGPVLGVACYQLDGIFIGATRTADMRNMMLLSVMIYLVLAWLLPSIMGISGMWLAVNAFYVARAATLYSRLKHLERDAFEDTPFRSDAPKRAA
jgi:MATE family multidrug resistance protein